jgi:hypothetical protein
MERDRPKPLPLLLIALQGRETGNTADQQINLKLLNIIWDVPNSRF